MRSVRSLTLSVRCGPTKNDRWLIHMKLIPMKRGRTRLARERRAVIEQVLREGLVVRRTFQVRRLSVSSETLKKLDNSTLRDIISSLDRTD
jgi:hypothetical protein